MHKFEGPNGPVYVDLGEVVAIVHVPQREVHVQESSWPMRTRVIAAQTQLTLRGGGFVTVNDSPDSIAALIEKELVV